MAALNRPAAVPIVSRLMEPRDLLAWLTVVGAVITVLGFVRAYFDARAAYADAQTRLAVMERLEALEDAEDAARSAAHEASFEASGMNRRDYEARRAALSKERTAVFTALYDRHELRRVTYDNITFIAMFESRRLLREVLKSTGPDLLIASVGLAMSTFASVASLYLPSA